VELKTYLHSPTQNLSLADTYALRKSSLPLSSLYSQPPPSPPSLSPLTTQPLSQPPSQPHTHTLRPRYSTPDFHPSPLSPPPYSPTYPSSLPISSNPPYPNPKGQSFRQGDWICGDVGVGGGLGGGGGCQAHNFMRNLSCISFVFSSILSFPLSRRFV
jgi:hypothetical protein